MSYLQYPKASEAKTNRKIYFLNIRNVKMHSEIEVNAISIFYCIETILKCHPIVSVVEREKKKCLIIPLDLHILVKILFSSR
jgi:hypothetical protein